METTEFLLARIAEDESVAKGALRKSSYEWSDNAFTEAVELAQGEGAVKEATEHIARWDPARVLAECEAKRRVVESVERAMRTGTSGLGPSVVRTLALPYADHPDYDEAWKV